MKVFPTLDAYTEGPCVAAMGMFDGMHIGHRLLLERARSEAMERNLPLAVVTYGNHPSTVLSPDRVPRPLMSREEKLAALRSLGVDHVILQEFTPELASTPAEAFLRELCARLRPRAICVGYNHTFGKDGAGNAELIQAMAEELGYTACVLPPVAADGAPVSSSRIRSLVERGELAEAAKLLGDRE